MNEEPHLNLNDSAKITETDRISDLITESFTREKIVYLLGAGFSAPLGVPTIKYFYGKSHELRRQQPKRYAYFDKVFEFVRRMGEVSAYYKSTDVLNIEQTLSMLDMQDQLDKTNLRKLITDYIKDVVSASTPEILAPVAQPSGAMDRIFWDYRWYPYGAFISVIFHIKFRGGTRNQEGGLEWAGINPNLEGLLDYVFDSYEEPKNDYSVITLNYDRVLEIECDFLNEHYKPKPLELQFLRNLDPYSRPLAPGCVYLAKLHGSVGEEIIPPTWRKDFSNEKILSSWQLARHLLRDANQIRILGYSLPASDAYVKDLLRVAAIEGSNLKRMDVLCQDPKGDVEQRYQEFIGSEDRFRFRKGEIQHYLWNPGQFNSWITPVAFDENVLEANHRQFFDSR